MIIILRHHHVGVVVIIVVVWLCCTEPYDCGDDDRRVDFGWCISIRRP
jgi:hypothetical protein